MASLTSSTKIGNGTNSSSWMSQFNIYNFNTTDGSGANPYLHFKTNVLTSTEKIFAIEAVGYNYGYSLAIRCMHSMYTAGGTVSSKGSNYSGEGLYPDGVYAGGGYACIRFYKPSHYYCGFILNAYTAYYYGTEVSILAASQNSTSGSYY